MSTLLKTVGITLICGFSLSAQAFEAGQLVAVKMACKTAASIEMIGHEARVSQERAIAAMTHQAKEGNCGVFRAPQPAKLVTMLSDFIDYDGDTIEIWRLHNGYFAFMMDVSKKSSGA